MNMRLCAPCLFGLEGPLSNELKHMGMKDVMAENGRVRFTGTDLDVAKANIRSRFAERILVELGSFKAPTFDELFEGTKKLEWESFIPRDGAFPVKGYSIDSELHSVPDCQKIIKKAVSVRLGAKYSERWLPETGATYQIQFSIMKNEVCLFLDTTGTGLHKRGYRPAQVAAPLRETLAAAMVDIAGYRGRGDFADPFCGSGTIAIEAALAAKGRAPGLLRSFSAQSWGSFGKNIWKNAAEEARAREFNGDYHIFASDIDEKAVKIAQENAKRAGVEEIIKFSVADAKEFSRKTEGGVIVTNPPYGERLLDIGAARELTAAFMRSAKRLPGWDIYIISSDEDLEHTVGMKAQKVRKLYNGMIKCGYYKFTNKPGVRK
ncbi:MAG: class I SAM-dependent RNA methyltransferase [Oscillospiraceae bacterium]|nr:class I SAM-dependent RNA methyltransferase [Oscillospiraceae bacterium]MBQ2057153.1 class I SAM-dependent RNA methyltransferase [Oscillospiraceae bacterium]MBQ2231614.1 class I SAM-dependent RNA methyltransferase [Oscillospiraceae bacterium]MBQ3951620.1 class I SAM-dependent RNA methyltransferase [Oscillospiraceae bacterium]